MTYSRRQTAFIRQQVISTLTRNHNIYRDKIFLQGLAVWEQPPLGLEEIRIFAEECWVPMNHPGVDADDGLRVFELCP